MNLTSNTSWNTDYTGYFNGKPCRVFEETHITLPFGDMNTREMVESEEYQMLTRAGVEVHRVWKDSFFKEKK